MSRSRLSAKCRVCPYVEKCKNKRMEAEGYLQPAAQEFTTPLTEPMAVKHDYRDIKVSENMTITVDVEEIKKEIEKAIYKGLGLNYGA